MSGGVPGLTTSASQFGSGALPAQTLNIVIMDGNGNRLGSTSITKDNMETSISINLGNRDVSNP